MLDNPLDLKRSDKCILVGNGPSVMYNKLGYKIDQFDEVLRFNECKIKGFEEYTGTKTTIWSTFGRGVLPKDEDVRPNKIIFTHGEYGKPAYDSEKIWRIPLTYYNDFRSKIQSESKKPNTSVLLPSSGVLIIKWLLDNSYDNLHIIGFDSFNKNISGKHHYWNEQKFTKPKEHDDEWETNFIQNLINDKKIFVLS